MIARTTELIHRRLIEFNSKCPFISRIMLRPILDGTLWATQNLPILPLGMPK
jgi:hypothetical protein